MSNEKLKGFLHWGVRSGSLLQNYSILADLRERRRGGKIEKKKKNCPYSPRSGSISILFELKLSAGGSFLDF